MKVNLVAHTVVTDAAYEKMSRDPESTDAEHLLTLAGRGCYQSYHRPRPETAKDADYLNRTLIQENHWSIAEHATVTFYVEGVSRSLTHELLRHRHLSPSELSQRFVNVEGAEFITPPALMLLLDNENPGVTWEESNRNFREDGAAKAIVKAYQSIYRRLTGFGIKGKKAREAARAVMPNCTETKLYISGNLRAWVHVLDMRATQAADAEIRAFAMKVYYHLLEVAPSIFSMYEIKTDEFGEYLTRKVN